MNKLVPLIENVGENVVAPNGAKANGEIGTSVSLLSI